MACFYSYLRFKSARFPVVFAPLHSSQRLSSVQLQYSTFFTSLEPGISFSVTLISPPNLDALASSMFFSFRSTLASPVTVPGTFAKPNSAQATTSGHVRTRTQQHFKTNAMSARARPYR